MSDYVETVPLLCIPLASGELPEEPVTEMIWGTDNELYTGHASGRNFDTHIDLHTYI